MNLDLIDIGANLTHQSFAQDLPSILTRAVAAGVRRQVVTGADLASSRAAARLSDDYPSSLWSTAGIHPHHAQSFVSTDTPQLLELLRSKRVVAVGECGLDYFRNVSEPAAQRLAFMAQLQIAADLKKPVFLHQRDAHADFMAILKEFAGRLTGGVAHCFTGGVSQLEDYLSLGLHIGVTGWVSDERRGLELRQAVPRIPAERLLLETDAPYLLPRDLHPKPKSRRNEPCFLPHIAAVVAKLRNDTVEQVAEQTSRNAVALFALTDQ